MKQAVKKVLVLFCMMSLVICSSQVIFAASNIVLVDEYKPWGIKVFEFQPSCTIHTNGAIILKDITQTDGKFYVPAGKEFTLNVNLNDDNGKVGYYKIIIYGNNGKVYEGDIIDTKYPQVRISPKNKDEKYTAWIVAYSNEITIDGYDCWVTEE